VITAHSLGLSQSLTTYMTSANGNSSLRTENSVFLAHESPFYLLCVISSLPHFFGRRPKGGGAWPKWPNGIDLNTPVIVTAVGTVLRRIISVRMHILRDAVNTCLLLCSRRHTCVAWADSSNVVRTGSEH